MLSRLGSASVTYNSVAVRNPVTDLDYHIYDVRHFELNPEIMIMLRLQVRMVYPL